VTLAVTRAAPQRDASSRNAPCGCGSGRRVKYCCGSLSPSAPRSDPAALEDTLRRALDLQRTNRLDDARACYEEALELAPESPDALHMLGVVHLQCGDAAAAIPLLLRAAESFGWNVAAVRHNLGLALAGVFADPSDATAVDRWIAYDDFRTRRRAAHRAFAGRVSVVVPSYNHEAYVREAIDSLRRQTRPADEVIVIDDGSSDDSAACVREAVKGLPGHVMVRARENRGAAATINEAVAASTGDFVNVLNSDDVFAPTRIATMIDAIACTDAEWGFSRVACIDAAGSDVDPALSALAADLAYSIDSVATQESVGLAFLSGNPAVSTGSLFFSRRLFDRVGGFADLRYNHDWDFCLRASVESEPEFVPSVQYEYRLHGANTILETSSYALTEMQGMFARFYAHAVQAMRPRNPFAPLPCVWGTRFFACALSSGHATMLPAEVLADCARRARAMLGSSP
jgi:glycosyltransferase involved in cell wall biosynthesis